LKRTKPRSVEQIEEFNRRPPRTVRIVVGENVKIHPSTSIGEAGFTWARSDDGCFVIAHNLGDVVIGDNVRIGEHCTVRRATLPNVATVIGSGSVLVSYVNVGHNCRIGKNSWLGPHVCLNGSVEIGNGCWIAGHAIIHQQVKIGNGAVVGLGAVVLNDVPADETVAGVPAVPIKFLGNYIHPSFKHGKNLKIGKYNYIHEGVTVGDDVTIRSYVELRKDTVIGDRCYVDSGVKSSGKCEIGDNVTLRYDSIIAMGVKIEDGVFISPQLMTENLNHRGEAIGGVHIGTGAWNHETKYRVFIGTNVTLAAGIEICSGTIIGSKTNVRKSILEPGTFVGNPARRL